MNLHFKTNIPSVKPHQWQANKLHKRKAHKDPHASHNGNPLPPSSIMVVQQATRTNAAIPPNSNFTAKNPDFNERNEFLAFITVLFRLLKNNRETARLHQAKEIIAECVLKHRNGNANFALWKHSVDSRLRAVVGDGYWCQAQRYVDGYKYRRGLLSHSVTTK